eukprot:EG_transcript_7920
MAGVLSNFKKPPQMVSTVDCTHHKVTRDEMSKFVFAPAPTVLKGFLSHYPVHRWSLDYFKALDNQCSSSPKISVARNNVEQAASVMEQMPLRDFVSYVEKMSCEGEVPLTKDMEVAPLIDPAKYMYCNEEQDLIGVHFPVLREELKHIRSLYPQWIIQDYSLWIGPKGSVTGLHADHDYNSLVQCQGQKTMIFIPSEETELVYPSKKFDPGASLSRVDLRRPRHNAEHFPNIQDATVSIAHLQPGDLICIPRKWWHFVVCTEGPSVSCTLHCNSVKMKAIEEVQKLAHRLRLYGWTEDGCTCHNA